MPYLIIADKKRELDRRELIPTEPITVGRSLECGIQVRDALLSRQHCRLEPQDGGRWLIVDLNSRNGTYLAHTQDKSVERIEKHLLDDGDLILLGRTRLTFRAGKLATSPKRPADGGGSQSASRQRPVDPHEALAGTISGFTYVDMEEESRVSGFPIPKPKPVDPAGYRKDDVSTVLEQLTSSGWDMSSGADEQPGSSSHLSDSGAVPSPAPAGPSRRRNGSSSATTISVRAPVASSAAMRKRNLPQAPVIVSLQRGVEVSGDAAATPDSLPAQVIVPEGTYDIAVPHHARLAADAATPVETSAVNSSSPQATDGSVELDHAATGQRRGVSAEVILVFATLLVATAVGLGSLLLVLRGS